ncbi:sigma-70 region 4 type 2 [[Clostridium] sordellii]|uniref:hypothetical protein n=1 Tax=Paraclostridium sordellii TaxID=1505 RepID=UPI000542DA9A|nr:hypothetical protein [Paeniclostridium sordellii]CEK34352.1 sigma-70 region 4 type 2 [[Clostridium] sordellii] [Paeniclostridium sordellii]
MRKNRAKEINAENEAKKLVKAAIKEGIFENVDKDLLTKLSKEVAKEALFEIINKDKDWRLRNTKILMENYNALKEHIKGIDDEINFRYEFRDGEREICVKSEYMWLESIAKSKARTIEMMGYVEAKIKYLIYEWESKGQREVIDSFLMFYIEDKSDNEIREKYNCGANTPKRWRDKILKELSVLLWGIDAIQM